jgi:ABC-type transport system involved in multi-copper enzyme maturation permease subunit
VTGILAEEVARARRREVVRFVAVAAIAGVLVGSLIAGVRSHRPTAPEWAAAKANRAQAFQECLAAQAAESAPQQVSCDAGPIASWLSPDVRVFDLASLPNTVVWSGLILGLAGWLLGGALIGADWANGTMAMTLTWEPRRSRLLAAKLCAAGLVTFLLSVALLGTLVLGLLVVKTRGLDLIPSDFWPNVGIASFRVALASAAAAVAAGALAFIARSATFAVAAVFVYLVVVEGPVHLRLPSIANWLIVENAIAWTRGTTTRPLGTASGAGLDLAALGVLLFWLAFAVGIAWWIFRSRDIAS